MAGIQSFFEYVDRKDNQDRFVEHLSQWVAVKSVSASREDRGKCFEMMNLVRDEMVKLGIDVELCDNPDKYQTFEDSEEPVPLPPIILGKLGGDLNKKTICVYGHLDVQPAEITDGWDTEPFVLQEIDGKLYGRGSTDDKGPVLCWLEMIHSFQTLKMDLPVNLKFCFEGMEESGSEGLETLIELRRDTFFKDVDYVCISDNYWLGKKTPCLTYGLRGCLYFHAEIKCAKNDLHSGIYGGQVHEGMVDLVHLWSKLIDQKHHCLVPGFYDDVEPLGDGETDIYDRIDFDVNDFKKDIKVNRLIGEVEGDNIKSKRNILMNRWRYPTLSLHGIHGAYDGDRSKTVIPGTITGHFSCRIVPNQNVEDIEKKVMDYCYQVHRESGSPNKLTMRNDTGGIWWKGDYEDNNFKAGANAMFKVFGKQPDLTREGGSIPVTLALQQATGKSVMLLPVGACDDGAHSQNEKFNRLNFINGVRYFS